MSLLPTGFPQFYAPPTAIGCLACGHQVLCSPTKEGTIGQLIVVCVFAACPMNGRLFSIALPALHGIPLSPAEAAEYPSTEPKQVHLADDNGKLRNLTAFPRIKEN